MSDTDTIKLQVPMSREVRDELEQYAKEMGFDSAQAYIRFWAKSIADRREVNLGDDDWGQPSDAAAARLNKEAEEAKKGINVSKPYYSVDEMMKDLLK